MTEAASLTVPAAPSARRLAVILMGGALLSKVLGLLREMLVARAIGASVIADSFRGGQTAVLLPLAFLQTESVPAILIPAYREWRDTGDAPRRFAALTASLVLTALLLFLVVEASAPVWTNLLLGGFSGQARELTLRFTRIMAFAMPASVLLSCLSAAEIARGQSRITSIRATLVNVAVIGGVSMLLLTGDPATLAWSFSAAFNAVAAWAGWLLLREGTLDVRGLRPSAIGRAGLFFLRRLRPLAMQPVAEYGQVWLERLLASALAVGTLASLDYARTLTDCAVLLVSQPLGLAVLSKRPSENVRAQIDALARPVLALAVPASLSLVVFAPEVVQLVFGRGAFGAEAVASTSQCLRGIAAGLWASTLAWILVRMLNSAGRNRIATMAVAAAYAANALTILLLVRPLGGLALGLGEAVRGIVLLLGVSWALGCLPHLLRLLLLLLPLALCLVGGDLLVEARVVGLLPRLLCGGALAAACSFAGLCLVAPSAMRAGWRRFA